MSVIFNPSDMTTFRTRVRIYEELVVNGSCSFADTTLKQCNTQTLRIYDWGNGLNATYEKTIPTTDDSFQLANTAYVKDLIAAIVFPVASVAGKTGVVVLAKADVGLGNVDNTTDLAKPISTLTQTALNTKQATLVSGTNIKTVNGVSVLGTGDITIAAGGIQKARFTATEGQTAFICTGITLNDPLVYLNGILQDQGDVYTYAGSTVTFVSARYLNEKIVVVQ